MNIITPHLEHALEIKAQALNTLVIEDTKRFTNFLNAWINTSAKRTQEFQLIEDDREIDISKYTELMFDVFSPEINQTSLLKKLYQELESDLNREEMYQKKIDLESRLYALTDDLMYRSRFSIVAGEIHYDLLFKAVGLQFEFDGDSVLERLVDYMKIAYELSGKRLFVIVNLDSFLDYEELVALENFLRYNEIRVLALQNRIAREGLESENLRIIDQDLCEI